MGVVALVSLIVALLYGFQSSNYYTRVRVPVADQPVPFSHEHHTRGLGIDCRYCHTTVEVSAFAGLPPTETCMTCHSQIWTNADLLEPVRASYRNNTPLAWTRVNFLPGYVYFNHSIHINKGIGCATCHGAVNEMPLTWAAAPLTMGWCLDCHNAPEKNIRPRSEIYNMDYQQPANQEELGARLVREYKVQKLTDCYTCHR